MENESNISFGRTSVRVRKCHSARFDRGPFLDLTVILHCTKQTQNRPMETTSGPKKLTIEPNRFSFANSES